MSGALAFSPQSTVIAPVDPSIFGALAASAQVELDGVVFHRKKEHHLTVFGFAIGKPLGKAFHVVPALRERLAALLGAHDLTVAPGDAVFRLRRADPKKPGEPPLETLIVTARADLAGFYRAARAVTEELAPGEAALLAALASSPTPHVTLYTSDPTGVAGIGLNAEGDLELALARGASGEAGLQAFAIAPETIRSIA